MTPSKPTTNPNSTQDITLKNLLHDRKNNHRYRVILLFLGALAWIIIWWVAFALAMVLFTREQYTTRMVPAGVFIALSTGVITWLSWEGTKIAGRLAMVIAGMVLLWTMVNRLFMAAVPDASELMILLVGSVGPLVFWVVALFLPVWPLEIGLREIYYWRRWRESEEEFELLARERPTISQKLRGRLERAGVSPNTIEEFIEFAGQKAARDKLQKEVQTPYPQLDDDLQTLFGYFNRRARTTSKFKWIRPLDEVWLLWDRKNRFGFEAEINEIMTLGGAKFDLKVNCFCDFNPFNIEQLHFRSQLPEWRGNVKTTISSLLTNTAKNKATTFFSSRTLDEALSDISVLTFREALIEEYTGLTKLIGVTVFAGSVRCTPLRLPSYVQDAVEKRAAAPALAAAETAKVERWIETLLYQKGISFSELSRLLLLESSPRPFLFGSSDFLDLPREQKLQQIMAQVVQPRTRDTFLRIEQNLRRALTPGTDAPGSSLVREEREEMPVDSDKTPPKSSGPQPLVDLLDDEES